MGLVDLPGDVSELGGQFEEFRGEDLREPRIFSAHGLLPDPVKNRLPVRVGGGPGVADGLKCPQSMDHQPEAMALDGWERT